eukprot:7494313-Ditylum_brightwellii.AAC.1
MKDGTGITLHTLCGASAVESLMSKKYTKERNVEKDEKQKWSTVSGTFQTKGRDSNKEIGLIINFANEQISWKENDMKMKPQNCTKYNVSTSMTQKG